MIIYVVGYVGMALTFGWEALAIIGLQYHITIKFISAVIQDIPHDIFSVSGDDYLRNCLVSLVYI